MFRLVHILVGLLAGAAAAALVQIGFVRELPDASSAASLSQLFLPSALLNFVFVIPFAAPIILYDELTPRRGVGYYIAGGFLLACAGLIVLAASETDPRSILNMWALLSFWTSGLVGGAVYWVVAAPITDD